MTRSAVLYLFLSAVLLSCSPSRKTSVLQDDGKIEIVFIQVNDVYEIAPLSGGKEGGMARVATLKKGYLKKNPNTFLVMAGDFLSPSVYNSLQFEGKNIRGRQMVETMNVAGMDFAVFGNHEFDIRETELQDRINESEFQWIASNVFHRGMGSAEPFRKKKGRKVEMIPETFVLELSDKDNTKARVGFIGITIPSNRVDFAVYRDPLQSAKKAYDSIKDSVDAVIAITHQTIEEDRQLAKELPGLAAILGGHEHDMRIVREGNVTITKAHANARSAWVVRIKIDVRKNRINTHPELQYINEQLAEDSSTRKVVEYWTSIAEKNYAAAGFDPAEIIIRDGGPYEAREYIIRHQPTNFSRLIVSAMKAAAPEADVVFFNAGSIRVDDQISTPITEYDLIRALPFGGGIKQVEMRGNLLIQVLDQGRRNKGNGGFLHYNENLVYRESGNRWLLNGVPLDPQKIYKVATTDFLLTGREVNLSFLEPKNKDILSVSEAPKEIGHSLNDIRHTIINYVK